MNNAGKQENLIIGGIKSINPERIYPTLLLTMLFIHDRFLKSISERRQYRELLGTTKETGVAIDFFV